MKSSLLMTMASDMRIQTARLSLPVKNNSGFPDLGLRSHLLGSSTRFEEELPPMETTAEKLRVWMLRDSFRCHYFMGTNPDRDQLWLFGPYLTEDLSLSDVNRRMDRIGLKNIDLQYLHQYYSTLPRIRDEHLLYSIVHNHCVESHGSDGFEIAYWEMAFVNPPKPAVNETVSSEYQRDTLEHVYAQERLMMDCIAHGNLHGALAAIHKLEKRGVESRSTSTIRDMKNFSIVFNTLCRIAASEGGVHPYDIDRYSRAVSMQLENAATYKELRPIRDTMLKEYCAMVRAVRQQTYSPAIQRAIDFIEARFSQNISLREAADELKLSTNYLSARFKKETGKSFSEHLTDVRIAYARQLLERTDLPISSIAEECGIPDNNYFSRVFRQTEGTTPRDYRIKMRKHSGLERQL